jgi:class 3 adenylate cyclase/predicted ATPase
MTAVREWLEGLGLGEYAEAFEAEKLDLEVIPELSEDHLKGLDIPLGPRLKILKAASSLQGNRDDGDSARQQPVEPRPPTALAREAERRQITVMFCDLVGSTALSERLDPEDLRTLLQAYQQACGEVIERYEGHVAQYLGDGLMTYFGWPAAHEDDAERAVRAGLEIVEAVKKVDAPEPLQVRAGIATGPVVVGETGAGDASVPKLAVGETPNLAARVQGLAGPDDIVIAPSTHRLVGGAFDYEDLGKRALKGIVEPVQVWRVTGVGRAEGRFEAAHVGGLTPLVGRETEIAMLMERWSQAKDGEGQVVLLCGEPGIGKSRIMQVLRDRVAEEAHTRLRYQCSPYYANSALYPFIGQIERAAAYAREDSAEAKLDKLEKALAPAFDDVRAAAPLFAAMLSLGTGDRYPPLELSPQRQKEETIKALAHGVVGLARAKPVLVLFEDAHWADPTTLEALGAIVDAVERAPILAVITFRPQFSPQWTGRGHVTLHTLSRLGRRHAATMVEKVTGEKALPAEVLDEIVAKTDGVPLFVEELTKTVLESGIVEERDGSYHLTGPFSHVAIPSTLHDSLMARLDRLAPVKEVAQIGACIGREFTLELLAAVSPLHDNELHDALQQLTNSELIFARGTPPDASYMFKHALVQDAAYESLLKSKRQQLHSRLADVLRQRFPDIVENEPEVIAHHCTEAGLTEPAIDYWARAGRLAAQRSSYLEAVAHLNKGLSLVPSLPDSAKPVEQELMLLNLLATPLMYTKGYAAPEAGRVYDRVHELCRQVGESVHIFQALSGISQYHMVRGDIDRALALAEEALPQAEQQSDIGPLLEAHRLMGLHCVWGGQFERALPHLNEIRNLFEPERHRDLALVYGQNHKMSSCTLQSQAVAALGYPEQALRWRQAALTEAEQTKHWFSRAYARSLTLNTLQYLRELKLIRDAVEDAINFAAEQSIMFYLAYALTIKGWLLSQLGSVEEGIDQMRDGLDVWRQTGSQANLPHFHTMLAEALAKKGAFDEALDLVEGSIEQVERWGDRHYEAEIRRFRGELKLGIDAGDVETAEQAFGEAIDVAKRQAARLWELRASTSLARLWRNQGKLEEARDLLAPVYDWFTEGFDFPDLENARSLLAELR